MASKAAAASYNAFSSITFVALKKSEEKTSIKGRGEMKSKYEKGLV